MRLQKKNKKNSNSTSAGSARPNDSHQRALDASNADLVSIS
jgi:hypothetical protein